MKLQTIAPPQAVNACTLISIAAINSILNAKQPSLIPSALIEIHYHFQEKYKTDFNDLEDGAGVLELDAYNHYFAHAFSKPKAHVIRGSVSFDDVRQVIENRALYIDETSTLDVASFLTFNLERIEAIEATLPSDAHIDWTTITEETLMRMMSTTINLSLREQLQTLLQELASPQGMTIRLDGHTTSITKRDNTYYHYDSLTGELASTDALDEMMDFFLEKRQAHALSAVVHIFSPTKQLDINLDYASKQRPSSNALQSRFILNCLASFATFTGGLMLVVGLIAAQALTIGAGALLLTAGVASFALAHGFFSPNDNSSDVRQETCIPAFC